MDDNLEAPFVQTGVWIRKILMSSESCSVTVHMLL